MDTNSEPENSPLVTTIKEEIVDEHESKENATTLHNDIKLNDIRTNVEDKSHLLTQTWNDLCCLLGEYKAELYAKQQTTPKYDGVSDLNQLKNDLMGKENENMDLKLRLEEIIRHEEKREMDLSVKESLLKKYQEDLLEKETALLTAFSKISKLENKLRVLECGALSSEPPRKMAKQRLSPRPLMFRKQGWNISPGVGSLSGGKSAVPTRTKSPAVIPHTQTMPALASTSAPKLSESESPIVCIEVDDEDEMKEITDATASQEEEEEGVDSSLYVDGWSVEDESQHFDSMENGALYLDSNQSADSQPGFSGATEQWSQRQNLLQQTTPGILTQQALQQHATNKVNQMHEMISGILRSKGDFVHQISIIQSGPRVFNHSTVKIVQSVFLTMQDLGLGICYNKGLFRKAHPRDMSLELLERFCITPFEYASKYSKPVGKVVAAHLAMEGILPRQDGAS